MLLNDNKGDRYVTEITILSLFVVDRYRNNCIHSKKTNLENEPSYTFDARNFCEKRDKTA